MAFINGLMVRNTRDNGKTVSKMEKEYSPTPRDKPEKVSGKMAKENSG